MSDDLFWCLSYLGGCIVVVTATPPIKMDIYENSLFRSLSGGLWCVCLDTNVTAESNITL